MNLCSFDLLFNVMNSKGNSLWLNLNFQGYDLGPSSSLVNSYTVGLVFVLKF